MATDQSTRTECTTFLPGDTYKAMTVAASVIYSQDDAGDVTGWTLLLINPTMPYFTVAIVERNNGGEWVMVYGKSHENIVPAVDDYKECGGDY